MPQAAHIALIVLATIIIDFNDLVIKNAVELGVISNATTKIIPTVCKLATVTSANKIMTK